MSRPAAGRRTQAERNSDATLIALFLDMLAAERGARDNTLAAYTRDLDDYSAHLAARQRVIAKADTEDIRAYLAKLGADGLQSSSIARKLSAIRQMHRFLYAEGKRGDDPAAVLEGPKRGRSLPKILSVADVDGLLTMARSSHDDESSPAERVRAARL